MAISSLKLECGSVASARSSPDDEEDDGKEDNNQPPKHGAVDQHRRATARMPISPKMVTGDMGSTPTAPMTARIRTTNASMKPNDIGAIPICIAVPQRTK